MSLAILQPHLLHVDLVTRAWQRHCKSLWVCNATRCTAADLNQSLKAAEQELSGLECTAQLALVSIMCTGRLFAECLERKSRYMDRCLGKCNGFQTSERLQSSRRAENCFRMALSPGDACSVCLASIAMPEPSAKARPQTTSQMRRRIPAP